MASSLGKLLDTKERAARGRVAGGGAWPWPDRLRVMCDVAEGMAQMHAKRFIHRDLKPDNVLIDEDGRAKIADLGMARTNVRFDASAISSLAHRRSLSETSKAAWTGTAGTPSYFAPEAIDEYLHDRKVRSSTQGTSSAGGSRATPPGDAYLSMKEISSESPPGSDGKRKSLAQWHAVDSYAFALILWEALTLKRVWSGLAVDDVWDRVRAGHRPPVLDEEASAAPRGYVALIRRLWHQDPVERPTFAEALGALQQIASALVLGAGGSERRRSSKSASPVTPQVISRRRTSESRRTSTLKWPSESVTPLVVPM